jgi:hypothetical protein
MFLGVSGSIAGGQMYAEMSPASAGTYSRMWKIVASYRVRAGTIRSSTSGFGSDRSMWQRHTHRARECGKWSTSGAGCGSWTITKS